MFAYEIVGWFGTSAYTSCGEVLPTQKISNPFLPPPLSETNY